MSDRLTEEEKAAIDRFLAEREPEPPKPRRVIVREPRQYPDRILPRVKARSSRIERSEPKGRNLTNLSIIQALHWAFVAQNASLELPDLRGFEDRGFGFGMEYILIQRAKLGGVKIDGGAGPDQTHEDAEAIAALVSNLSDRLGGRSMAIRVADIARSCQTPDYMAGAVPRLVPMDWHQANQRGKRAKSERLYVYCEQIVTPHPKNPRKTITRTKHTEVLWTPCRWDPSIHMIEAARKRYLEWWLAVDEIRLALDKSGVLREVTLSGQMPSKKPWAAATTLRRDETQIQATQ